MTGEAEQTRHNEVATNQVGSGNQQEGWSRWEHLIAQTFPQIIKELWCIPFQLNIQQMLHVLRKPELLLMEFVGTNEHVSMS